MRSRLAIGLALLVASLCRCANNKATTAGHSDASLTTGVDSGRHDAHSEAAEKGGNDAGDAGDASDASLDADAVVDAAPFPCGTRTGMRGLTSRSVVVDGKTRTYLIYLPTTLDPTAPMPFVFVFHGFLMSGRLMYDITQYTAIADADGVGVAFPDGDGGPGTVTAPWNDENPGQLVCGEGQYVVGTANDFGFIDAMKADVSKDQCLDTQHVFTTGFSMGGYFAEHVACYRDDMRAVAPHSGGTIGDLSVCTSGHVPMIIFHGTKDSVIDEACDDPTSTKLEQGFPASGTLWAAKNGCSKTYTTLPIANDAGGGTGQCYLYDDCPADGQVEVCTFNGMDHCWAGGSTAGDAGVSACPTYPSATQLEWQFFKQYAW